MNLQANQREIVSFDIWKEGVFHPVNVLKLAVYSGYDFIASPGQVHYDLIHHEVDVDGSIYEEIVAHGYVPLTFQIVSTWGVDDQPIFDYVAQELSITLV
jgi:hypothetical protein